MDRPATVERQVVAGGINGQAAKEFAVLGNDPDVSAGHEEKDTFVGVGGSDADVSKSAAIAQGDGPGLVDAVMTNAVLD